MPERLKTIRVLLILLCFSLLMSSRAPAEEAKLDLELHEGLLSADIEDVELKAVIESLESNLDIWVRGGEPFYELKISVEFSDLSIVDGIERMFYRMLNYCFLFDDSGHLKGVMLFKRPEKRAVRTRSVSTPQRRYTPPYRRYPRSSRTPAPGR